MKIRKTIPLAVSMAALLAMTGCADTKAGNTTVITINKAVHAQDGNIEGATICLDLNTNGTCDTDEPFTTSDILGQGKIDATKEQTELYPLVVSGGTDTGTNKPFVGTLTAPAGSTMVTPLSSAVQALVKSGKTHKEAETAVKVAFGIPDTIELKTFDAFDSAENGTEEEKVQAQKVMAQQTKLQIIVHSATTAVASASKTLETKDIMSNIFEEIVVSIADATEAVEISPTMVALAAKNVAAEEFKDDLVAQVTLNTMITKIATDAVETAVETAKNVSESDITKIIETANAALIVTNTATTLNISKNIDAVKIATATMSEEEIKVVATSQAEQTTKEQAQIDTEIAVMVADAKVKTAKIEAEKAAEIANADDATQEQKDTAKKLYDTQLQATTDAADAINKQVAAEKSATDAAVLSATAETKVLEKLATDTSAAQELKALLETAKVAEKAAAEQAAAEADLALIQAEKDLIAAQKAAKEAKAATDLEAAQKAAEKIMADAKIAAEKVVAEKAAAEKAIADAKVAAEKAAADAKAAAEKAAAEKAAAKEAAAKEAAKIAAELKAKTDAYATLTANAGSDQTVIVDNTVTLDSSSSQGTVTWSLTTTPAGNNATIIGNAFTPNVAGIYVVTITVSENNYGQTKTDTVTITVNERAVTGVTGSN